ncbi:MAG TPA: ABC transporter substrate-binding protein [Acidimicrobiales bacterium]|nr:ABC transporter substrate-binding protein [Acidimicrobiales bacterium]
MNISRARVWVLAWSLVLVALVAGACGGDSGDTGSGTGAADAADAADQSEAVTSTTATPEVEGAQRGGSLTVALEAETNSWRPGQGSFTSPGVNVGRALYDGIAARGADGDVHPLMAESIVPNEDLTEWTVTLRPGITFTDGTPLDAQNQKATFDTYLASEGSNLAGNLAQVAELRVDDELTYTYVLTEGNAAFLDLLAGTAGWPFSFAACQAAGDDCGSQPVGAGPFQLDSWTRDDRMVLVRNESYWRTDANGVQLPYLDQIEFRPIADEDARLATVRAGDAQVGQTLRPSLVRQAREATELESFEAIGNVGGGVIFNTLVPPVDDQRVRLGLAHALVQEDLVDILGATGLAPPQTQWFSPSSPWFSETVEEAWPTYEPDTAATLLQAYIDDPARSDGKAPGSPISVTFSCPPDPSLVELSLAYQAFWSAVGVEVQLLQIEQAPHVANAIGSPDTDPPFLGDYMINCWRNGSAADPYTTLATAFGPVATEPQNFTNYTSASIDDNLTVLRTSTDVDERYAAVESIMLELTEQVPNLWTNGTPTALYARPDVRNLAGWTIPTADGDEIVGSGVLNAEIYWAEVWLDQ